MYAVVKTGGKQFRVCADDVIKVEKLSGEAGDIVTLDEVLMVGGDAVQIGSPTVAGASVAAEILEQARDRKIVVFKKRRRHNYRRKKGHRQAMTVLKVREILTGGAKSKAKPAAKPAAKAAPAAEGIKDDVSLIGGVGPKLKERLADAGVTSLKQIAEMDEAALRELGETVKMGERPITEEWAEQARELLAGKPPRAKTDQAAAEKKDD
ncbi:MAG: 50S ribosomal protein L21 [Parvularcula sp.]